MTATQIVTPSQRISLDANATTRPFPEVVEIVTRHLADTSGNPGSRHAEGRQARRVLEAAREQIADLLGANPGEVVFTSGGTEANNLAILGRTQGPPGTIAISAGEHPATLETVRSLVQRGWRMETLPIGSNGRLLTTAAWFEPSAIEVPTDLRFVAVLLANNETGVIQDIAPWAKHCQQRGVPLLVDAVQAAGKMPLHFHDLGATLLSIGAHKFHGPRGVGALFVRDGVKLAPLSFGGHQEAGRRPGTEPVALIAGMAKALELCVRDLEARTTRLRELRDRLQSGLQAACAPTVINGSLEHRLSNTLNIAFPGVDGEALLVALDLAGVACSLGSACASGSAEPSPVLLAMNCPPEIHRSSVRLSVSTDNTLAEIDAAITRICQVVTRLRA